VTPPVDGGQARSAFFAARASTAGTFILRASYGELERQLGGAAAGAYHLTLLVGDALMTNSGVWPLGRLLVTPAPGAQPLAATVHPWALPTPPLDVRLAADVEDHPPPGTSSVGASSASSGTLCMLMPTPRVARCL
jgi:hypothetical protein